MSKYKQLTEEQIDNLAERELLRLQRQFRNMENDRLAYSDETKRIIFKQSQMVTQLEKEKTELLTLMACSENKNVVRQESYRTQHLQEMLDEYDQIGHSIDIEGKELKELEAKIDRAVRELMQIKNKHHIIDSNLDEVKKQERTDENLETRLYYETVKFNKLIGDNQRLRQEIDHLLIERGQFNQMFQSLVGKLNSGKKVLMDLIEQSTMAYDRREEALSKLEALRTRAKQDLLQHSQEMRELIKKLDYETKLNDFIGAKGARRVNVDLEALKEQRKRDQKVGMELHLQEFKKIIAQIKVFFNETDVERLATSFLKLEEDNYNLFSFVNELNKELGVLREQVCELREQIDDQNDKNKKLQDEQDNNIIELQNELAVKTQEADEAQSNLEQSKGIVNMLLLGIHAVFKFIQCNPTTITQLLGSNAIVTTYNYLLFLEILEKRVIDIVNLVWYLSFSRVAVRAARLYPGKVSFIKEELMDDNPKIAPHMMPSNEVVRTQPCPLCIEQADISEVDESIAVPLTKEEILDTVKCLIYTSEYEDRLHNVSACRLPKSRRIMQRRFQN